MLSYQEALREPCLSRDAERQSIQAWQADGSQEALGRLTTSHARLAWSEARRWSSKPADIEDLAAEGMLGLIEAANAFDLDRDVRFATYAIWFVKNRIVAASAQLAVALDMPARVYLDARAGRLDPLRNADALAALDSVAAETAEEDEAGVVVACPDQTPEERVLARSSEDRVKALLADAIARLDPMERIVIDRHLAPDETAAMMPETTPARARAIERRAMHRLRHSLQEQGFSLAMLAH